MSEKNVSQRVQGKRRKKKRTHAGAWIAALIAVLLVAGVGAWVYFRGLPPKAELYLALHQWTKQWRAGDGSALEKGMLFGVPRAMARAEEDELSRTEEERRKAMEPYAALLQETAAEQEEEDLLSVLLPHTEVSFSLPNRVEAGAAVTFTITGPDMAQILPQMEDTASPEALREKLRAVLTNGGYPERTVTAQAPIEELESGYRLRNAYALIDGLYGGLPGIVAEALPAAQ